MLRIQALKFNNYLMFILFYFFTRPLQKRERISIFFVLKTTSFFFNLVVIHHPATVRLRECVDWFPHLFFHKNNCFQNVLYLHFYTVAYKI